MSLHLSHSEFFFILGQFRETLTKEVKFEEIRSEILEIVIQYFHYKVILNLFYILQFINENRSHYPKSSVETNLALEVLRAALYLET